MALDNAMMAYDAADHYLVVFGGFEGYNYPFHSYNDTWIYRAGSWTETHPSPSPPPLDSGGFAEDPLSGCDVLYGGVETTSASGAYVYENETWTYCHSEWHNDSSGINPGKTADESLVSDPQCGCIVAFGLGNGSFTQALWMYSGGIWRNITPAVSPPARYLASMAYDSETRDVILFGGDGYAPDCGMFNDTWELTVNTQNDSATWKQDFPSSVPPNRFAAAAYSVSGGLGVGIFGGILDCAPVNSPFALNDTWLFRNGDWENVTPAGPSPAPRGDTAVAFDPRDNCTVLFGGARGGGPTFGDTWTYGCERATFAEQGLPKYESWSADLNGTLFNSTSHNLTLYLGPGSYSYDIPQIAGLPLGERYHRTPATGTLAVIGLPVEANITFELQYEVTIAWQPLIDGWVEAQGGWVYANGSTAWFDWNTSLWMKATPFAGSVFYRWIGYGSGNYTGPVGNVTVLVESPINETAVFGPPIQYPVIFAEQGLPRAQNWSVVLAGVRDTGIAPTIYFSLSNGTYSWSASTADSAYLPSIRNGTLVVDGNATTVAVSFFQRSANSSGWVSFPFPGVDLPGWVALLLVLTLGAAVVGLVRRWLRRRSKQ